MDLLRKNSNLYLTLVRLRRNQLAVIGLFVMCILILTAVFAPLLAPYHYATQNLMEAYEAPSWTHLLGTDEFGRDILSRIIWASRISLQVGCISVSIGALLGGLLGSLAGYYGGKIDNVIMRLTDVMMAIPSILLAISIAASLGPGLFNVMVAVGISSMPPYARIIRGSVLAIREQEFVEAAKAMGSKDRRIILRHVLPNCLAPIIVQSTLGVAQGILSAASLSFIGLGIQPPTPEWGSMLSSGRQYVRYAWWVCTFPGLAIMISILSLNLFGDGLRDALDPKLKN